MPSDDTHFKADAETANPLELQLGVLCFSANNIGRTIKVTYTAIPSDYDEIIGSLKVLKDNCGVLTDNSIYLTGGYTSVHPYTAILAEKEGITLCEEGSGPMYRRVEHYARIRTDKFTIPVSDMFKTDTVGSIHDTFVRDKTKAQALALVDTAIAYCKKHDLPYEWYDHDFLLSETNPNGVWLYPGFNSDWKKPTFEETRDYFADYYTQLYQKVNNEGVEWMFREDFCKRMDYIHKYVEYEVRYEDDIVIILVKNNGGKCVKGMTFRIPSKSLVEVKHSIPTLEGSSFDNTNNISYIWFDLPAGTDIITCRK